MQQPRFPWTFFPPISLSLCLLPTPLFPMSHSPFSSCLSCLPTSATVCQGILASGCLVGFGPGWRSQQETGGKQEEQKSKATVTALLPACGADPGQPRAVLVQKGFSVFHFRFWKQLSPLERQPAVLCKHSVKCFTDPASKPNSAFSILQNSDWKPRCCSFHCM